MGTRADFYIGRGKEAEWLGSVAWDGIPDSFRKILIQVTEKGFREMVAKELASRDDATAIGQGWPWPWDDSNTTDFSYAFDGKVYISCFGHGWDTLAEYETEQKAQERDDYEEPEERPKNVYPDMRDRKNVTLGHRSGVLVFSVKP